MIPIALVVGGLVAMAVTAWLDPLRALAKLPIDIGNLVVSGTKITMQQPRLAGFTSDARPYEITARAAAQDFANPDMIELQEIWAMVEMQDRAKVQLTARVGLYDSKREKLTLRENILITSSRGYEGKLSEALVDFRSGNVLSEKPVELKLPNGTVVANKLEVMEAGNLIRFDNGVTVVLTFNNAAGNTGAP